MNCNNCGVQLNGTETVCPNCGTPVQNVNPMSTPVATDTPVVDPVAAQPAAPAVDPMASQPATPVVDPVASQPATPVVDPVASQPATPVVDPVPSQPAAPVVDPMAAQPATPVVNPVASQPTAPAPNPMAPQTVTPTNPAGQITGGQQMAPATPTPAPTEQPKKGSNKMTIILVAVLALCIIGAAVYFLFMNKENTETPATPTNNDTPTQVSTETEQRVTYGGYSFKIPNGYSTEEDVDLGLVLYSNTLLYSINVDYTNAYETYLVAYKNQYPDQADKLEVSIGGRKYIIMYGQKDGKYMDVYITKATDTSVFVGVGVRSDYTALTANDFTDLTTVLNNATTGTTSFAPGDNEDAGKNGLKTFEFTEEKFNFAN